MVEKHGDKTGLTLLNASCGIIFRLVGILGLVFPSSAQ
jgi:hypothetical protein